jgi:hypothetical protein
MMEIREIVALISLACNDREYIIANKAGNKFDIMNVRVRIGVTVLFSCND